MKAAPFTGCCYRPCNRADDGLSKLWRLRSGPLAALRAWVRGSVSQPANSMVEDYFTE